jgi:nucleotide-binding universal stress UspA family protein
MDLHFKIEKILVAIDFSDTSRKAFYTALKLARQYDAQTTVLHVAEPIVSLDSAEHIDRQANDVQRMEAGVRRRVNELFTEGGLAEVDRRKVVVEIGAGKPWLEIVRYAYARDMDLIVMGSQGASTLKRMLLGSQTDKVVRHAHCMVLTVKPDGFEVDPDVSGPRD